MILSGLHSRSAEPPPGVTGADHWVAAAFLCANKPKKTAGADVLQRHDDRSDDRAEDRQRVADAVAAAGGRGSGRELEQLRRRLQLHLHEHDFVGLADVTAADGAQSAGRLRAHVRRRQHVPKQRAARRKRDSSILDSLTGSLSRMRTKVSASDRQRLDDYTDNVREIERRLQIAMKASTVAPEEHARAGRRAADVRRAHQAAVRPAGARLPGRHHARRHAALRARPHGPHLSGERGADRRLPRRVASRRESTTDRGAREDQPVPRQDARATSSTSCRRRRMATARCSIIRWCSTAATWATRISTCTTTCRTSSSAAPTDSSKADVTWRIRPRPVPTGNLLLSVLDKFGIHQDSIGDSTGRLEAL